ncbi:MAG: hypothetical protein ACREQ9_20300, partial [Candidatus Binatia bacterium]
MSRGSSSGSPAVRTTEAVESSRYGAFRRRGDYWTISYRDQTVRLRDAKGLRYLACLLRHPERELHVVELASEAAGSPLAPRFERGIEVGRRLGHAGEVLDARAIGE